MDNFNIEECIKKYDKYNYFLNTKPQKQIYTDKLDYYRNLIDSYKEKNMIGGNLSVSINPFKFFQISKLVSEYNSIRDESRELGIDMDLRPNAVYNGFLSTKDRVTNIPFQFTKMKGKATGKDIEEIEEIDTKDMPEYKKDNECNGDKLHERCTIADLYTPEEFKNFKYKWKNNSCWIDSALILLLGGG